MWANGSFPWVAWRTEPLRRAGMLAILVAAAGALYFGALMAAGLKLRQFVTH
jgi:putative peptidoglycan lipid II flippase